jgi:hypothetical protein
MPTGVTNPHRGRKTRLVSLLESLYRRSAASGANASRVRAGNPRLDEAGRWKREAEIEQATGSPPQGELGQRSSSMKAMHQRTMLSCSALSAKVWRLWNETPRPSLTINPLIGIEDGDPSEDRLVPDETRTCVDRVAAGRDGEGSSHSCLKRLKA